jgi:hypothetical protein
MSRMTFLVTTCGKFVLLRGSFAKVYLFLTKRGGRFLSFCCSIASFASSDGNKEIVMNAKELHIVQLVCLLLTVTRTYIIIGLNKYTGVKLNNPAISGFTLLGNCLCLQKNCSKL